MKLYSVSTWLVGAGDGHLCPSTILQSDPDLSLLARGYPLVSDGGIHTCLSSDCHPLTSPLHSSLSCVVIDLGFTVIHTPSIFEIRKDPILWKFSLKVCCISAQHNLMTSLERSDGTCRIQYCDGDVIHWKRHPKKAPCNGNSGPQRVPYARGDSHISVSAGGWNGIT